MKALGTAFRAAALMLGASASDGVKAPYPSLAALHEGRHVHAERPILGVVRTDLSGPDSV